MTEISISIRAYEAQSVDDAAKKIIKIAQAEKAHFKGPVPMPRRFETFTILRSPHLYKKARDQFEIRTHKRLIVLKDVSPKLLDGLKRLEMPSGVEIELKISSK